MHLTYILIQIVAAVFLVVPNVFVPLFAKRINTLSNLKRLFKFSNWLGRFSKVGGLVLLLTGLGIMWEAKIGFSQMWLNVSIILVVVLEIIAALIAPKKMRMIAEYIIQFEGNDIPENYKKLMKEIVPYNALIHLITLMIMLLMIFKPF